MGADSAFVFSQSVAGAVLDDVADILQAEEFEHFIDIAAFMSVEVEADPLGTPMTETNTINRIDLCKF